MAAQARTGGILEGRRALVTGAASGIGLATARRLAEEGARVAAADLDEIGGKRAADQIGGKRAADQIGGKRAADQIGGFFVRCDVTDPVGVAEAFRQAEEQLGGLDIVHLNAGVTTGRSEVEDLTDDEYRRIIGVNVDGVVFGVREAIRALERSGGGSIVATASIAGLVAYAVDPIYAATKHAVIGLVRGVAPQVVERGITINAVCPGITDTPMIGGARQMLEASGFPIIKPEEIAEGVVQAITGGGTGEAWVCQAGREPLRYEFRGVPGPRTPGKEGMAPPDVRA
jgi:NAD(P)-dependent dehydrogenase (short-subunit alcohol dehydrogenase family)